MTTSVSTGRGGAGNISSTAQKAKPATPTAATLATPTIKSATFTTGRGGSGNMATNDPERPEVARAAQDVSAPERKVESTSTVHHGRGGAANVVKAGGGQGGEKSRRPSSGLLEMVQEGLERIRSNSREKLERRVSRESASRGSGSTEGK